MRDSVITTKGRAYKIWNEMLVAMLRIKIALKFYEYFNHLHFIDLYIAVYRTCSQRQ